MENSEYLAKKILKFFEIKEESELVKTLKKGLENWEIKIEGSNFYQLKNGNYFLVYTPSQISIVKNKGLSLSEYPKIYIYNQIIKKISKENKREIFNLLKEFIIKPNQYSFSLLFQVKSNLIYKPSNNF